MLRSVFLAALLISNTAHADRPNILFAFADDWGFYASQYAALDKRPSPNAVVKTPHFDSVATDGVLFTNAFVPAPSCTPCRSSLLSGRYFFRTGRGAILQGAIWDAEIPTFPLLLKDSGYHIGKTFKVWSPGKPRDAPYGGKEYEYESAGDSFNGFSMQATQMVSAGKSVDEAKQTLYEVVERNFDAFLRDRPAGSPFCYWFGPTNTHRRWVKGSGKTLWGIEPDDLIGKLPAFLPDVPEVREDMADYLGEVMAFDAALGCLLRRLDEIGEAENTLVVVSGDHGIPGFPRSKTNLYDSGTHVSLAARWPDEISPSRVVTDFVTLMDLAPTFLEAGGVRFPSGIDGKSLMGILRSDRSGRVEKGRSYVITGLERHVAAARDGNLPYPCRAIRTDDYLYVRNLKPNRWPAGSPRNPAATRQQLEQDTFVTFADMDASPTKAWLVLNADDSEVKPYYDYAFAKRPAEELYHLATDPDQFHNVASNPEHAPIRQRLAQQMQGLLRAAGDPRFTGNDAFFDTPPFGGP